MRHVTVLGFDYAFASAITGVSDLLSTAGVTWNYIHGHAMASEFNVEIATLTGAPVLCANNIEIKAHRSINDIKRTDLLLIPTIAGDIDETLKRNKQLIPWIVEQATQGADIASNCTGAFLLAETGLLNHKMATTHWGFVDAFRAQYPDVNLQPEQLITADGAIFCSGGGMAWLDMALFLIERYCGYDIAMASAKSNVFDISKSSRAAYTSIPGKRYHQDAAILRLQDWLDNNYHQNVSVAQLAEQCSMTVRTLNRRFKQATGDSLIYYLQCLRVDAAKKLLKGEAITIEAITQKVGYQDVSSFIRLFKKHTGLSPSAHRARYS